MALKSLNVSDNELDCYVRHVSPPVLQINKDDVTALQCKVVCLIQNGNFKEALGVINTHSKVLTR